MEENEKMNGAETGQLVDVFILSENLAAVRTLDVPEDAESAETARCRVAFLHLNDEFDPGFRYDAELSGADLDSVVDGSSIEPVPEAVKRLVTEPVRERSMWTSVTEPATVWMPGAGAGTLVDAEGAIASQTASNGADVRAVLSALARPAVAAAPIDADPVRSRARVRAALVLAVRSRISKGSWEWVDRRSRFELACADDGSETACLVPSFTVGADAAVSISGWAPGCTAPLAADPFMTDAPAAGDRDALMREAETLLLNRTVEGALPGCRCGRDIAPVGDAGVSRVVDTEPLFAPLSAGDAPGAALEVCEDGTLRALRPLLVTADGSAYLIAPDDEVVSVVSRGVDAWPAVGAGASAAAEYRERLVAEGDRARYVSADAVGERRGLMAASPAPAAPSADVSPETVTEAVPAPRIEVETGCGTLVAVPAPAEEGAPGIEVWLESHDRTVIDQIAVVRDEGGDGPTVEVNDGSEPTAIEVDQFGPTMQRPVDVAPLYVLRSA